MGNRCIYKVTTAANHREGPSEGLTIFGNLRGMLLIGFPSALREANIYERLSDSTYSGLTP